jgi:RNA polymerase sigma factor (sigma-70 family)
LLHQIRRLAARPLLDADADAVLLRRFVDHNDQDAFTELVVRHGPMVLGVCRRVLHDVHEAEDVSQAVLLVLARKAASLRRPERLAAWLHGVARHLALCSGRAAERRRRRETGGVALAPRAAAPDPLADLSARELLLLVDEEIERLPAAYRLPVILCCLEGRTQEEAARVLGCSPGAIRGRLERGRKQLRTRLARCGLELSAVMAALELARGIGTAGISASLVVPVIRAAFAFGSGAPNVGVAPNVAALAEAALRTMMVAKLRK